MFDFIQLNCIYSCIVSISSDAIIMDPLVASFTPPDTSFDSKRSNLFTKGRHASLFI
jgi:hypothetical protein